MINGFMKSFPDEDLLLFRMTMEEDEFEMMFEDSEGTAGYCIINIDPRDGNETFLKWNGSYYVRIAGGDAEWTYMVNCKEYHYDTNCSRENFEKILNDPRMFTLEAVNGFYVFYNVEEPFYPYTEYVSFGEPAFPTVIAKVIDRSILDKFIFDNFVFRGEIYAAVCYDSKDELLKIRHNNGYGHTIVSAALPVKKNVLKGIAKHYQLENKSGELRLTVK